MSDARWTNTARSDLGRIDDFYRSLDPHYAAAIGDKAIAAGRFLASHPHAGALLGNGAERKWRVAATPFLLIYRPIESGIQILRVRHASEDWRPAE